MNKVVKGLNYIAIGLVFVIVNLNITINTITVNFLPEWIGFVFLFFGVNELIAGKNNYKWLPVCIAICGAYSLVTWILEFLSINIGGTIFQIINVILQCIAIFFVINLLIAIAKDFNSTFTKRFEILRAVIVISYLLALIAIVVATYISEIAILALISSIILIASVIVLIIMVFMFKNEVQKKLQEQPTENITE